MPYEVKCKECGAVFYRADREFRHPINIIIKLGKEAAMAAVLDSKEYDFITPSCPKCGRELSYTMNIEISGSGDDSKNRIISGDETKSPITQIDFYDDVLKELNSHGWKHPLKPRAFLTENHK